ncbi:MAG: TatD family hydrolase [Prolixibacteraceae bacterium]|jgi:TatD DNase family protein
MLYIDIHTHRRGKEKNIQIRNVFAQDLAHENPDYFFSAGLHPWHISEVNPEQCYESIEAATENKNMLAIGECGLDRHIKTDFALQKNCFKEQVKLAEKYDKPLIIHCVRAYPDLIKLKKDLRSTVPWILHAYSGNRETTQSLLKHGFYFSLEKKILKDEKKRDVSMLIPTDRIFLETDEGDISIQKIYLFAAEILQINEELLGEILINNFKTLFGDDKLVAKD